MARRVGVIAHRAEEVRGFRRIWRCNCSPMFRGYTLRTCSVIIKLFPAIECVNDCMKANGKRVEGYGGVNSKMFKKQK